MVLLEGKMTRQQLHGSPESGVSGIETPPPLEELGLEEAVGVEIGVLKKANRSTWAALTFLIPKTDWTFCFYGTL